MLMNYKKDEVLRASIIIFIFFAVNYYVLNSVGELRKGFSFFLENTVTAGLSYYGMQTFYFVVVPVFLIFLLSISKLNLQYVVRSRTKLNILCNRFCFLVIVSFVFMFINTIIGVIFPIVYFKLPSIFITLYSIQGLLCVVVLVILGTIYYIINTFINKSIISAGVIYLLLIISIFFSKEVTTVLFSCGILTSYYLGSETTNIVGLLLKLGMITTAALIVNIVIMKYEEFYNGK